MLRERSVLPQDTHRILSHSLFYHCSLLLVFAINYCLHCLTDMILYFLANFHTIYVCVFRFYIGCDKCQDWFHGACVGITAAEADSIDFYTCPRCTQSQAQVSKLALTSKDCDSLKRLLRSLQVRCKTKSVFVILYVKANSREICEEISFSHFFQKNANVSIFVELQG